jgi:hypothetical protein
MSLDDAVRDAALTSEKRGAEMVTDEEKRLEFALERERVTTRRQSLLKRLWRLRRNRESQPKRNHPPSSKSEKRETTPIPAQVL